MLTAWGFESLHGHQHRKTQMVEKELLLIVEYCEELVQAYGVLSYDTARTCMYAYETLKELVADGDYTKYREWYELNAPLILNEVDS